MSYIYYANGILELIYEDQNRELDPDFLISVPDDFDFDHDMEYSVNFETKELIVSPKLKVFSDADMTKEDASFDDFIEGLSSTSLHDSVKIGGALNV